MLFLSKGMPLVLKDIPIPHPNEKELLVRTEACGVCRTDLHILEGDLTPPHLPLILGHEIVGIVEKSHSPKFQKGDRVGISWLGKTCGFCEFCQEEKENLCEKGEFTGFHRPGGFAEYTICHEDFAIPLPQNIPAVKLAPLLCSGLIGYRAYRKADPKKSLGLYGFGAAAHLLIQIALHEKKEVYAFTKEGDLEGQKFAKKRGAIWAGSSKETPPKLLDAAILFAPAGELIPLSLKAIKKGGRTICAEIHMTDIPSFPYKDLWGEKRIESVANVTREDALLYFEFISKFKVEPEITLFPLEKANEALQRLKQIRGAAVIDFS